MVSLAPLSTRVSVADMEVVDEVCRSAFGCGGLDQTTIALLILTAFLAVLVLATIVHLSDAMSIVDEERVRLAAERDAFDAFSRQVAGIEASETTAAVPAAGGIATATATGTDRGLDAVQSAYRDTVMAVEHYEADYGEPLAANLAAELGDGLAYAVVDGQRLTPQLKSALLSASRDASGNRDAFLCTLEAEAEALDEAGATLQGVDDERERIAAAPLTDRSYEALVDDWRHLGELADRCRAAASDRQDQIRSLSRNRGPPDADLHDYLYEELPVAHPVLADSAALVESLGDLRSRFLLAITRRV